MINSEENKTNEKTIKPVTATITTSVLDKVKTMIDKGIYRNRSHAIEEGLKKLIAEQES